MKPWQKTVRYCAIGFAAILIVNIIGWAFDLLGWIFVSPETVISEESQSFEFSADIYKLDIEISAAVFSFRAEECEKITVTTNLKKLTAKESGGRLKIKDPTKVKRQLDSAFVEIVYPIGTQFDIVDIDGGAGRLEITALTTKILDLDLGAGETVIHGLSVGKDADIDGGAGALTFSDSYINDLDLDMGVGELIFDGKLLGKSEISLGVGKADMTLIGKKEDYMLKLEKGIGEIFVDGTKVGNSTIGDGSNRIEIDGGIGEINVKFAETEE